MSTFDVDFIENQDMDVEFDPDDEFNVGFGGMRVVDYNDQVYHKPRIEGVELVGDVSLNDLGAAHAEDIPTDVSELNNDAGYITASDIPPLVTDLGYIDPEQYDEDVILFMNTLKASGFYKFVFGGDDLTFFVAVQSVYLEDSDTTLVNQHYWGDEEGPITEYIRAFILEGDEVVDELATSYLTMEGAIGIFASKLHVHYRTASASLSVWDYCNGNQISFTNDSPILYTDTRTPRHAWLIETAMTLSSPNVRFIRLTDLEDASKIYQRSGTYSNGVITWGDWEYIGGMKITVDGTNYPITAITKTTVSGVSGVLVDYDDGNSGQLFFADGAGLNTVKSAIELTIPHDTSELTNGAGFITISDLPIYDGGVQ